IGRGNQARAQKIPGLRILGIDFGGLFEGFDGFWHASRLVQADPEIAPREAGIRRIELSTLGISSARIVDLASLGKHVTKIVVVTRVIGLQGDGLLVSINGLIISPRQVVGFAHARPEEMMIGILLRGYLVGFLELGDRFVGEIHNILLGLVALIGGNFGKLSLCGAFLIEEGEAVVEVLLHTDGLLLIFLALFHSGGTLGIL